ncbi:LLM class flavin-dependent oxidoreductase [Aureimonas frigidaquae]|uniref:LLM class flavin-dependent oxidoreductase n=1 Tax=Aureimonas frigidaquae TaxID=424757 RepID=UPI0007813475|nr:LLM class flavin-dependent oxidoreductase [Aureimonas frigidaquae]
MPDGKEILLNAFAMNCVGHINHGLWTHPRDRSVDYHSLQHWTQLAQTLERGLFDGLFLADIVGAYDVYGGNVDLTLRESIQLPVNDPLLLVPAMAAVTRHLGFGVTVNINVEHPYTFARRISTLDHLTQGRVGWNIVTGYLDSAARAVGQDGQAEHDLRYDRADEYLSLARSLWEDSWDDDAVRADRAARIYADPAKVRPIRHQGRFYRSEGYHLSAPSPQRTPVIFQAGSSGRGLRFAAANAECVFISASDKARARALSRQLRAAVVEAGRAPQDVKIFVGITVTADATEAAARERHAEYLAYASADAGLAHFSASTGIDFSRFDLDEPIAYGPSNAIQSATSLAREKQWTRRQLLGELALGGRYATIVGDGGQVAEELASWIDEGEIDGFNLARTVVPESFETFVDHVVPELQSRGRYKADYTPGTLRHKLFGKGDGSRTSSAQAHVREAVGA